MGQLCKLLQGNKMSDIFCHIGLRKTGTTFLQDRFFPALSGKIFGKN